jgi:ribosomal protein S18 acetylase RimI-like enzyme
MGAASSVIVRDATVHDAAVCGGLLFTTWPDLYRALLGNEARATSALAALFTTRGNTFSFDASRVAEQDGEVVGLAASYPADEGQRRATGSLRPAVAAIGPLRFLKVLWGVWRIADASIGVDPRHFYLANVAVDPRHRSLGAGTLLMGDAEQRAHARGFKGVSLEVDGHNAAARRFYERLGYRVVEARESAPLQSLTGSGTRLLMSKPV